MLTQKYEKYFEKTSSAIIGKHFNILLKKAPANTFLAGAFLRLSPNYISQTPGYSICALSSSAVFCDSIPGATSNTLFAPFSPAFDSLYAALA